jgi:hypothetical protein
LEEEVEAAEPVVLRANLAVLAERSLEVVVEHRQVVPERHGRRLVLHEGGEAADGVGAAVVHVVAGRGAAGAELDEGG